MDIDAVVFDMDGVLVDSEPLHYASTNEVLARYGAFLEQADYDPCRGMSETAFFALLVETFGLDASPERLAEERVRASLDRMAAETLLPMDGALACLLGLAGEGYRLALASSARRVQVELVVAKLGLGRLFSTLVSLDDVERGKPEPDLFLEAARRLDVDPARCLVVEDSVHGVEAARRAGMVAVALPPPDDDGDAHRAAGAVRCLTSLAELDPDALERWGSGGD